MKNKKYRKIKRTQSNLNPFKYLLRTHLMYKNNLK